MSLFSSIGGGIGNLLGGGSQPSVDMGNINQYFSDVSGIRDYASSPVTGVSTAGKAAQDLATQQYQNQLDTLNQQNLSSQATGQAGLQRYGADSGANERLARSSGKTALLGNQQLGQANLTNQANIGASDIATQQSNKYNAMMQTPSMQLGGVSAYNQASIANQSADAARRQGIGNTLGTLGQIGGTAMGGPLGGAVGGVAGNLAGGLFS